MGTGFELGVSEEEVGIIPRAVEHLFGKIEDLRRGATEKGEPPPDFKVNAQFMEVCYRVIVRYARSPRSSK